MHYIFVTVMDYMIYALAFLRAIFKCSNFFVNNNIEMFNKNDENN